MPRNNSKFIEQFKFKKGQSGNPAGRPKKYVSTLKEIGYNLHEINDMLDNFIGMDHKQITEITKSSTSTILERIVARALIESEKSGSLYNIETLLTRRYGRPAEIKQSQSNDEQQNDYAKLSPEQIAERIKHALEKSKSDSENGSGIAEKSS